MKRSLVLIPFLFITLYGFTQQTLSGLVVDTNTKEPLPFATVISSNNIGTITDVDGKFELNDPKSFNSIKITYVGFQPTTIPIAKDTNYISVSLEPAVESLNEVILIAGENPALRIIRNTIKNKRENDIERKLNTFRFYAYNKLVVTANPDSIRGSIDSIFKKENGKMVFSKIDSTNFEFKKTISRSHLYMTEKASEYRYTKQKGKRENILATRMAGFKEPIYEVLAVQLQSFSFYKNKYTLFGTDYINPIANGALREYDYKILDTINKNKRPAYMIYYKPKRATEAAGMEGVLYIDTTSYALQRAIAQLKAVIDVKAEQQFEFQEKDNIWFPKETEISIVRGKNGDKISLFGGAIQFEGDDPQDSTAVDNKKQDISNHIYLSSKTKNYDFSINVPLEIEGRGLAITYDELAAKRDESFWNKYRTDSISKRGLETYKILDSIVEEEGIEKDIRNLRTLISGYFPTKYVDISIAELADYNEYEGFKLGFGGRSNASLSTKYRIEGFLKYGFKDKAFKYGIGGSARLNRLTDSWIGLMYSDDLQETGSTVFTNDSGSFFLKEPRTLNSNLFHQNKRAKLYLTHDLNPKLSSRLEVAHTFVQPKYTYQYNLDGQLIDDHRTATASLAIQWNPFSEYTQTPNGRFESKKGYPKVTAQFTKGFDALGADLDFNRLDLKATHQIKGRNRNLLEFSVNAGIIAGDTPLQQLFHNNPNNINGSGILDRLTIAGVHSFETMYFNEFFSDKYVSLEAKKKFRKVKFTKNYTPGITLISRFAIGGLDKPENHISFDFKTLEKGYFESGIEVDRFFSFLNLPLIDGIGLSFTYRYGAYHLPNFDDNISLKLNYNIGLGF